MTERLCARPDCGTSLTNMRADAMWCSRACKMAAERSAEREQRANGIVGLTQTKRLMRQLAVSGERGVTQVDFLLPHVIDGGKPITRIAARVKDARDQGEQIVVDGERDSCAVYKLASAVSSAPASPTAASYPAAVRQEPALTQPAVSPPRDDVGADETTGALFDMPTAPYRPGNALTEEAA